MPSTTADIVNQWAAEQLAAYEEACSQPDLTFRELIKVLKNVLAGITSTVEGANRIESLVMSPPEEFFNKYASAIYRIVHAGAAFDDDVVLQRLAALTAALADLPNAKNTTNKTLTWADEELGIEGKAAPGRAIVHDRQRLWSDLPTFSDEMRQLWNGPASKAQREEERLSEDAVRQQWSNCNAFAAHLTKLSQHRDDALDYRLYAIWTLKRALEDRGQPLEPRIHIPGAAQWIRLLGEDLGTEERKFSGHQKKTVGGGSLYDAEKHGYGFSPERWALWRTRFESFAQDGTLDEETRRIARDAANEMA
ncbi:hypothetical protein DBV05_g3077 [Lasiodiplodia theobromae]|uniref:Uncharacterized protein n=1 Tax=Lasiodiplodia theobromae TaxID=45133 RepID=A0A5N5DKG2_9PEZI|nr:hypothetical protein DBV05_g3077 [Lasiodiplodia theobromae]